jgi:hypothetical protein
MDPYYAMGIGRLIILPCVVVMIDDCSTFNT